MSTATGRLSTALADRYRIERRLGEGGMATVYLAEDLKHKRKVALKVLKPELAAVLGAERFVVEIRTTAALQHPHILPLFDPGTADGWGPPGTLPRFLPGGCLPRSQFRPDARWAALPDVRGQSGGRP